LKFFSAKSESCLGLDIGTSSIKCVELTGSLSSPKVKVWGIEPIPYGSIEQGAIVDQDSIISALNTLVSRCRVKTKNVCVAISSSHAITKVVQMADDLSEGDIEDMVASEAAHFVPYSINEVNLDFQLLGPSKDSVGQQDVFIAACRSDIIDDYVSIIEEVGLLPKTVDIDTYAIERLYLSEHARRISNEPVAVVDVGMSSSKLTIFEGADVIFTRQQKFGAKQLIALVRQQYGLTEQDALKVIESESPPSDLEKKVLKPYYLQASGELSRALQFFYSSTKHKSVSNVFFTGGISNIVGFSRHVGEQMGITGKSLSQFEKFSISGNRAALINKAGCLSVATGLALRGIIK